MLCSKKILYSCKMQNAKYKLPLNEDDSSRTPSIHVYAQDMTQMFTTEAKNYSIFCSNQAFFQTCIRTQPCPVLCQILATVILKLLGGINFGHFQPLFLCAWFVLGQILDPCLRPMPTLESTGLAISGA